MEEVRSFFDTYALYELIVGNPNYSPYKDSKIITTKSNLMELHYALIREYGIEVANKYFDNLSKFTIEIPDEAIKKANQFKHAHKKQKLSYVDCIGYVLAKLHNIKFLTGDKEFKDFPNVEFVK